MCPPWIPNCRVVVNDEVCKVNGHHYVFDSAAHFVRLIFPSFFWGLRRPLYWPDWALSGSAAQRNLGWDLQEWHCSCKRERGWIPPRWGQWLLHFVRSWGYFDHKSTKEKVAHPSKCSRVHPVSAYHFHQCSSTSHSFEVSSLCCTSSSLAYTSTPYHLKAWQYYWVH